VHGNKQSITVSYIKSNFLKTKQMQYYHYLPPCQHIVIMPVKTK